MTAVRVRPAETDRPVTGPSRRGAVRRAARVERRKLAAQLPARLLVLICGLGPLGFAAVLGLQGGLPADTLFGVWVHTSGFAVPLVVLGFAGAWGLPVLAGVLAGDIFSAEDRHGTWKTVLTRSGTRRDLFVGKALAAGTLALVLLGLLTASSVLAGLLLTGDQSLVSLSGRLLTPGQALTRVLVSWLTSVLPMLAFVSLAVLCSVVTRNGIMGVLGPVLAALLMQLLSLFGSGGWVHALLVSTAFRDWHGLLTAHPFYGPLLLGSLVSVAWIGACLTGAWLIVRRRDFAGAPVTRRPGWAVPVRVALATAVLIAGLAAGTDLGPAAITSHRLASALNPAFSNLTILQQRALGRHIPAGAKLNARTVCARRGGASRGPGDDWTCTVDVFTPQAGPQPFLVTQVGYDLSVTSDGCYKAAAPPTFIGRQMIRDVHGRLVVNPLFTIYGCFDTT